MQKAILKDFPNELYTKRLFIRMPLPGDGNEVHKAILASKQDLKKWLPFAQRDQTVDETEMNVREAHLNFLKREDLRLHIFNRETKDFIGCTGLHRIDWEVPKFEIGYWIDSRKTGNGYITEAVQGVTEFAFNELNARRVEIQCDTKNLKSIAVAERLGYTLEGVHYNDSVAVDGAELRDTCIYAKIK
ncbi:GNAT family N-acetyltransferase [Virgibacillus sp. C22-A2]|uniref:GNAT family N-acetyltransferase n=1 Tax=Virgibacillus tibetensis TaxID=3042313 RepID=A0ABU6KH82_9BACI|nr:GNAT family N-acetyltransferase [Virgibacillus sp. C22-A2]